MKPVHSDIATFYGLLIYIVTYYFLFSWYAILLILWLDHYVCWNPYINELIGQTKKEQVSTSFRMIRTSYYQHIKSFLFDLRRRWRIFIENWAIWGIQSTPFDLAALWIFYIFSVVWKIIVLSIIMYFHIFFRYIFKLVWNYWCDPSSSEKYKFKN